MSYVERVIEQVKAKNAEQPEFIQAVTEVLTSLEPVIEAHPEYEAAGLLERIVEPERVIMLDVYKRQWIPCSSMSATRPSARLSDSTVISKWKSPRGLEMNPLPKNAPRR